MDLKTQKILASVITDSQKNKVSPFTTKGEVTSITDDVIYVKMEGSDISTPIKASSASVKVGDIVDLSVSHTDTHITGNRTDAAASTTEVQQMSSSFEASRLEMENELDIVDNKIKMIGNTVNMQNNEITMINDKVDVQGSTIEVMNSTIETMNSTIETQGSTIETIDSEVETQNSKIETIESTVDTQNSKIETIESTVETQNSKIETIESTVETQNSKIETIGSTVETQGSTIETLNSTVETQDSSIKILNSAFVIQDGKLTGLSEIITRILQADYVTTDFLNAEVGWIEDGKIKQGAIGTVEIHDASVTTEKVKDLSADVITTGTLKTERLILTTDEVDPKTGEKKVALITALNAKVNAGEGNILDGAVIKDETIEAAKITVVDLNAFGATIGNFEIGTSSMHNGKTSLTDPTNGVYIGTDGIALGQGSLLGMTDDSPLRVESDGDFHLGAKDSNYINFNPFSGELDINAKTIKMGSKTIATSEEVESILEVTDEKISSAVGGVDDRLTKMEQDAEGFTWTIDETAIVSTVTEYYRSTSPTSLVGGSWSTYQPEWTEGTYIWSRSKNTNGKGTVSYTTPACITGNTGATGSQGPKGDAGETGPKGNDGIGISNTTVTYQAGSSGTTVPTGTWSTTIPSVSTGQYLWTKTVTTYTSGDPTTAYSVGRMGEDGQNGTDGSDGKGIKSTNVTYQAWSSGTSTPTGEWSISVPSTTSDKPYLWTKTVITYTDNTTSTSYSVGSTPEGIKIGGRNLLSDTNVPSMTKKVGPADKYLSDSENSDYSTGDFVEVSGLPIPDFTHVYRFTCSTASSKSTAGRSLCFYSGAIVPMIDGEEYTMSMYARKTSGNGKIRFLVGYSKYPNYDNYIEVDSKWRQYSYTFTYSDSATGGSGGARCYFGASCAVVGVVETFGYKLEKGNKATDWDLNESGKVATNYMNFDNNGLTIGNMTESTLGRNVLIDSDSVDIRNGEEVLASYGENITLYKNGINAFTIKDSTFLNNAINLNDTFTSIKYGTNSDGSTINAVGSGGSINIEIGKTYKWRITVNSEIKYIVIFPMFSSFSNVEQIVFVVDKANVLYVQYGESSTEIPCVYLDENSLVDLVIKGSVTIDNSGDINGKAAGSPPLLIGTDGLSEERLEIDSNEISAKHDAFNPGHLYLNMEGGNVSINDNADRSIMFQDGCMFTKRKSDDGSLFDDKWIGIIDGFNESNNTTFAYGNYLNGIGQTNIYGNKINLTSRYTVSLINENTNIGLTIGSSNKTVDSNADISVHNNKGFSGFNTSKVLMRNFIPCNTSNNCVIGYGSYNTKQGSTNVYGYNGLNLYTNGRIVTDSDIVLPNTNRIQGKNTSGELRGNVQPCNSNNNFVLGYGSYSASEGATNLYGNAISFITKKGINSDRRLKVLWSGVYYMSDEHTISLSESISNQLNGIVLAWSAYENGAAKNYWWNYTFIPKQHVLERNGQGIAITIFGNYIGYKYLYVSEKSITGNAVNDNPSYTMSGVTCTPNKFVLRYVYGV